MSSSVIRKVAVGLIACCTLVVVGCSKVKGTYTDQAGIVTIEFKGSGKAVLNMPPVLINQEIAYEESGDKLTLHPPAAAGKGGKDMVLTINSDGSLSDPNGIGTLKKKG